MITAIWDEIVETMTWFCDSVRDFLFGSPRHTIDPHARYADNFVWPDWTETQRPAGCEYCGMELARCGCGKYPLMTRPIPGIIAFDSPLTKIEVERLRKRMASAFSNVPFGMALE